MSEWTRVPGIYAEHELGQAIEPGSDWRVEIADRPSWDNSGGVYYSVYWRKPAPGCDRRYVEALAVLWKEMADPDRPDDYRHYISQPTKKLVEALLYEGGVIPYGAVRRIPPKGNP